MAKQTVNRPVHTSNITTNPRGSQEIKEKNWIKNEYFKEFNNKKLRKLC